MPGFDLIPVKWEIPEKENSIQDYASRLYQQINTPNPIIIGVSFGGMMAIEIAKLFSVQQLFLLSTVKSRKELPRWIKSLNTIHAQKILPNKKLSNYPGIKIFRPVQDYFLGVQSEEERILANHFRENADPVFLKWALKQIFNWQNQDKPLNFVHIHGDKDKLFPINKVAPSITVKGAGHFMVMSHAAEVSRQILHSLKEVTERN